MLTRETILQTNDLLRQEVSIPELNDSACVRELSGPEREEYSKEEDKLPDDDVVGKMALLASMTVCDETGALLFTQDDREALRGKSMIVLTRLFRASIELSKLTFKKIEELSGNSQTGRSDSSSSESQKLSAGPIPTES